MLIVLSIDFDIVERDNNDGWTLSMGCIRMKVSD